MRELPQITIKTINENIFLSLYKIEEALTEKTLIVNYNACSQANSKPFCEHLDGSF